MNAGRELDALVAEKVMGWIGVANRRQAEGTGERLILKGLKHKADEVLREVPRYSVSILDAWEVAEHFTDVQIEKAGRNYEVTISGTPEFSAVAETPACAICLAALRAIGHPAA
ncbi:MAG: hypothetical protein WAS07_14830 [Micropruina sp.]